MIISPEKQVIYIFLSVIMFSWATNYIDCFVINRPGVAGAVL